MIKELETQNLILRKAKESEHNLIFPEIYMVIIQFF